MGGPEQVCTDKLIWATNEDAAITKRLGTQLSPIPRPPRYSPGEGGNKERYSQTQLQCKYGLFFCKDGIISNSATRITFGDGVELNYGIQNRYESMTNARKIPFYTQFRLELISKNGEENKENSVTVHLLPTKSHSRQIPLSIPA